MSTPDDFHHHILSVLVQNRPGVLARVAGLFARRGFNIFSLAVAPAEDDGFSRITIVVDVESTPLEQITKRQIVPVGRERPADERRRHVSPFECRAVTARTLTLVRGSAALDLFFGKHAIPDG